LLNSGTFLKRNGKWQVVNWQSTRIPGPPDDNRKDVEATLAAFDQALLEHNQKRLSALVDPGFDWSTVKSEEFAKRDKTKDAISVYGETAVVHGENYTMTMISQIGAWKIVSFFNR